jgi:hypothetical protein
MRPTSAPQIVAWRTWVPVHTLGSRTSCVTARVGAAYAPSTPGRWSTYTINDPPTESCSGESPCRQLLLCHPKVTRRQQQRTADAYNAGCNFSPWQVSCGLRLPKAALLQRWGTSLVRPVVDEGDLGDMAGKRKINPECAKLIPVKLAFDRLHASLSSGFPRQVGLPVLQVGGNNKLLSSTSFVTNAGSADGAPFEPAAVLQGGAPTTSQGPLLSNLFVRPVAAILDSPMLPQLMPAETPVVATAAASIAQNTKHRRLFNLSAVRRSARLANGPHMPIMQRAQRYLCRKLGLLANEGTPNFDNAFQDFQAWFQKPLSKEAGVALEALFNIHMPDTEHVDKALMGIAGEAIEEIQDEMDNLQAEARSNAAARLVAV